MGQLLGQLADFELRSLIRGKRLGWKAAKEELENRIAARKHERGLDPSLKYETGIYGSGNS